MIRLLKSLKQRQVQLFPFLSRPKTKSDSLLFLSFSSSAEPIQYQNRELKLTEEELTRINLLIPRLCLSNHLTNAVHLTITSLITNPPPNSISLSILIHSLTSEPDLTRCMSFLTRLRHARPSHSHLTPITGMLITSYLKKGRPKEALKIYNWVHRPGSVCDTEPRVYGVLVGWLCRNGFVLEGFRVLRDMIGAGLVPGEALRRKVFRSLLREARVKEAKELDEALSCLLGCGDDDDEGLKKVLALLDHMIVNWTE